MRGTTRCWTGWVWNPCLPPNISAFLWKMVRHALPVDSRIQTRGIVLVSKCRCCQVAASETLVHLFIQSEVAVAVWKCFGELFNMLFRFRSILQAMAIWMAHLKAKSQYSVCRLGLVAYIFRELWVARSSATFEGKIMKAKEVCLKVMYRVQLLKMVNIPKNLLPWRKVSC